MLVTRKPMDGVNGLLVILGMSAVAIAFPLIKVFDALSDQDRLDRKFWLPVAGKELFCVLMIVFLVSRRRSHRRLRRFFAGQCLRCGYQTNALEVCPGCGTARATVQPSASK